MIKFDIITIFPEIFNSYLNESLIARALKKKLIGIKAHNLRDWTTDNHQTVDDRPFGGGLGMVLKVEPIYKAVTKIKGTASAVGRTKSASGETKSAKASARRRKVKVVLFTPRGKKFNQKMAGEFAKLDQIVFISGRYEGVDERVAKNIADIELSIGDYDLMGGELPAMIVIEAVSRLVPGVLGKEALLKERVTKSGGFIEYAQYTRPEVFKAKGKTWKVPDVLLSGNHKNIEAWKTEHGKVIE